MNVQKHNILRNLFERTETFTVYTEWITHLLQSCEEDRGVGEITDILRNITSTPSGPVIFPINEVGITLFL